MKSSIRVFLAKADCPKPEGFGSRCVTAHHDRRFFVSISHVADAEEFTPFLETNQPFDGRVPITQSIGGICNFDKKKATEDMSLEDFELILQKGNPLDIAFANIKHNIELLLPEIDFKAFKVGLLQSCPCTCRTQLYQQTKKGMVSMERSGIAITDCSFPYPDIKAQFEISLHKGEFFRFLAPQIVSDSKDYEGCSGAPILDSHCRIAALACAVHTGTKIIYGFPIQKCKELLDHALQTGMLNIAS